MASQKFEKHIQQEICDLYNYSKLSTREIAELYNCCSYTVRKIVDRVGRVLERKQTKFAPFTHSYFREIDSKDKAYFLGLLMADGSVHANKVRLGLQEYDLQILNTFAEYVKFTGKIYTFKNGLHNLKSMELASKEVTTDLARWGVVPNKTFETRFPPIEEKFWSHFIRGVFDGDGCIFVGKKNASFSITGNRLFMNQIQEVLMTECDLNRTKLGVRNKEKQETATMTYGGINGIKRIYDYLYQDYDDLYIERKFQKFEKLKIRW